MAMMVVMVDVVIDEDGGSGSDGDGGGNGDDGGGDGDDGDNSMNICSNTTS